jgi:hypothetical protein
MTDRLIITRKEAKALGLKRYFTGKPCRRGHVSEKSTTARGCIECALFNQRRYRAANRDKRLERRRQLYAANRDKHNEQCRLWKAANLGKVRERNRKQSRIRYWANPEKMREQKRRSDAANQEKKRKRDREFWYETKIFINAARNMGLIRKGDARAEQFALISYYRRIGIFQKGDSNG